MQSDPAKNTGEEMTAEDLSSDALPSDTSPQSSESPALQMLHCMICRRQIPAGRDQRQTATCSEKCKDRLDAIRANQREQRKCSHCLKPSTPQERAEFREWRASRGDLKRGAAKVTIDRSGAATKQDLFLALRAVLPLLVEEKDRILAENPSSEMGGIAGTTVPRRGSSLLTKLCFWIPKVKWLVDTAVDKRPESARLVGEQQTNS